MTRVGTGLLGITLLLLAGGTAAAQVMPAPKKAPRTPVNSEVISNKEPMPASRLLEGKATVLDAERLKIGGYEVRLFGIVPPQMSASNGPQARAVVDALAAGTVTCRIKDRDREGRLLALCSNEAKADFGIELLRRGLAASARGSLQTSDYAASYLAAEQAAQEQRLGIWAGNLPAAASEKSIREAATKAAAAKAELARLKEEEAATKAEIEARTKAAKEAASTTAPTVEDIHAAAIALGQQETAETGHDTTATLAPERSEEINLSGALDPLPPNQPAEQGALEELPPALSTTSFVERYQLLITGLLFLIATLCVVGGVILYRLDQKKEDLRSIAAALRGELMAARSICQARLAKIAQEESERNTSWPRIRTLVFQAYVGRLGQLGSDLSRQIASIYGQASDYASYYNTNDERSEGASKRQALESLVHHIEEITPRLSTIEKNGFLNTAATAFLPRALSQIGASKQNPLSLTKSSKAAAIANTPDDSAGHGSGGSDGSGGPGTPNALPTSHKNETHRRPIRAQMAEALTEAKSEVMAETTPPSIKTAPQNQEAATPQETAAAPEAAPRTENEPESSKGEEPVPKTAQPVAAQPSRTNSAQQTTATSAAATAQPAKKQRPPLGARAIVKNTQTKKTSLIDFTAPIFEKLSKLKDRTAAATIPSAAFDPMDFSIPDYANLTEEELEALLYAEEEMITASPVGKSRQTG